MDAIQKEVTRVLEKAPGVATYKSAPQPSTSKIGKSTSHNASGGVMDALDHLLEALEEAKSSSLPAQVITAQLQQRVAKCSKTINDKHKEYYNALAKLGKALDKKFVIALDDVTDVKLFQSEIAQDALKRVVRDHLERTGECEVARMFEQEAHLNVATSFEAGTFQKLNTITSALRAGDLGPAIRWASQEEEFLASRRSPLGFYLHRSRFLKIALGEDPWLPGHDDNSDLDAEDGDSDKFVEAREHHDMPLDPDGENMDLEEASAQESNGHAGLHNADGEVISISPIEAALLYGQRFLRPQQPGQLEEITRLFTYLLYLPEQPQSFSKQLLSARVPGVYQNFLNDDEMHASALVPLFQREFTASQDIAREAPLHLAVEVGAGGALNLIIRVRTLMKAKGNEWSQADELPVEIPLPPHLRFHSIFACPVSKEQGTDDNPPMMMACGHVVCQESLTRLGKGTGRVKCPYCPIESTTSQAIRVYF